MKKCICSAVASGFFFSGCAGIAASDLTPIQNGCTITLVEDLAYEANRGVMGTRYEFRTIQGDYKAIWSDQTGIFYEGSPSCHRAKLLVAGALKEELVGKVISVSDCGLYVPKGSGSKISMYVVTGTGANRGFGDSEKQVQSAIAITGQLKANGMTTGDSEERGARNISLAVVPVINRAALPPLQAGVAGGIAGGMVSAIVQAERGRYVILPEQLETSRVSLLCK